MYKGCTIQGVHSSQLNSISPEEEKLRKNRLTNIFQILTEVSTQEYNWNPEEEMSSYNIDGFRAIYISKLKWAWQA